jgi:large subunit ribosomal protein L6
LATSIKQEISSIDIPETVTIKKENNVVTVKGKLGTVTKDLTKMTAIVDLEDDKIVIKPYGKRKKDLAINNTIKSIIESMIAGVDKGFTYKLKIVYAHFPISVKTKGKDVYVENYFGERSARLSRIIGDDTRVNIDGEDVIVQGPNLEHVSQTAANIERSTKLKHKDQRVFLDGVYVYSKE